MFSLESGTQCAVDLVQKIFPPGQSRGHLVISRRSRNGTDRAKVPVEHAILYARQTNCFSGMRISTASFMGKGVLLNIAETRVVSFQIPFGRFPGFVAPMDFVDKMSWRLRVADIPQFSGVLCDQSGAVFFWVLDQALNAEDFYDGSVITRGIDHALGELASNDSTARVCDTLRLPVGNSIGGAACSLYFTGTITTVSRRHLYERALKRLTAPQLDAIRRSGEIIKELRDLLFYRLVDCKQGPETHWNWLTACAAAMAAFTDANQLRQCLIAVAESISGKRWGEILLEKIPGWSISYEGGIQIIQENCRNGLARLEDGHYSLERSDWLSKVARGLNISHQEVTELRLVHLIPEGVERGHSLFLRTPARLPVGFEDFVPAGRLVMRAA